MYLYKESEILNELTKEEADYIRSTNININTDIVEFIDQLTDHFQLQGLDDIDSNPKLWFIEGIIDKIVDLDLSKYVRVIFVEPNYSSSVIDYCISDLNDFKIGDEVLYKRKYDDMEGIVKEVGYYKDYNLPKHQDELYTIKEITNRSSIDIDN